MSNHVHVLLQPIAQQAELPIQLDPEDQSRLENFGETPDSHSPLASIMHSLKSYTANMINRILHRSGQLWQHESYDHWIRATPSLSESSSTSRRIP